jgi:hypothetical protein
VIQVFLDVTLYRWTSSSRRCRRSYCRHSWVKQSKKIWYIATVLRLFNSEIPTQYDPFETSGPTRPKTQLHIPENVNSAPLWVFEIPQTWPTLLEMNFNYISALYLCSSLWIGRYGCRLFYNLFLWWGDNVWKNEGSTWPLGENLSQLSLSIISSTWNTLTQNSVLRNVRTLNNVLNSGEPDCCYFIQYERVQSTVCSFIQSVKISKYNELVETSKDQKSYVTATLWTLAWFGLA